MYSGNRKRDEYSKWITIISGFEWAAYHIIDTQFNQPGTYDPNAPNQNAIHHQQQQQ